jgi:hypothetical protein
VTDGSKITRPEEIRALVELAGRSLPRMQLEDGMFCFEVRRGEAVPVGRSIRYTAMTLIGLTRAEVAGYDHGLDLAAVHRLLRSAAEDPALRPGDLGVLMWVDAVRSERSDPVLVRRLDAALAGAGGLERLEGQQLGWLAQGLALQHELGGSDALLRRVVDLLVGRNQAESGLFFHVGARSARRRFPNFATQIYSVLALSTVARLGVDARAEAAASRAADRLLALQLDDGGWPWLYDAARGRVVERYRVYSVHQHAMAPMGLLALADVSPRAQTYLDAALRGVPWIRGVNELRVRMIDERDGIIYRSIRRRHPWNRIWRLTNTAASAVGLPGDLGAGRALELNATCRPYELGWLLEAWAGRENLAEAPVTSQAPTESAGG